MNNLEKYKKDLYKLISLGQTLMLAMRYECYPIEFKRLKGTKEEEEIIKVLPGFED